MAKPQKEYTTDKGRPSVWNQTSTDVGNAGDKETMKIFDQMTGDGLVSTQQKSKGNNRRV